MSLVLQVMYFVLLLSAPRHMQALEPTLISIYDWTTLDGRSTVDFSFVLL